MGFDGGRGGGEGTIDTYLLLLREEGGRGRGSCCSCSRSPRRRRSRPSATTNSELRAAAHQLRLQTLYFCVFGLQQRVFGFDDGVLRAEGINDGIFGVKGNG